MFAILFGQVQKLLMKELEEKTIDQIRNTLK